MPPPKKKTSTGLLLAIIGGGLVVLLLLVWFLVLPRIVASKITAEADRRALSIDFSTPTLGFSQVTLRDVVVQPKANAAALKIQSPTMTADLSGFSPTQIHMDSVSIDVQGAPAKVNEALNAVREADAKIPPGEKLPVEIVSGKIVWKDPLGDGTSMKFDAMHVLYDPRANVPKSVDATLQKGTLDLSSMKLSPLDAHATVQGKKTHVTASLDKDAASLDITRDGDGDVLDLTISGLNPSDFDAKVPGLNLKNASIDGALHYERDPDGAAKSNADIKATKLKLPPISIGPLSIALGTSLRLEYKATAKKGSPGAMKIEKGTLEIAILGTTRTVTFSGELHVGEDGTGPFKGNISWSTETFQCADLSPIKGVTGTIGASGTLTFDLADLGGARLHPKIDMNCDLSSAGLNQLLQQIP